MNATLDAMIARLTEDGAAFGRGSAYADLHAICCALDAARLRALDERNRLREMLAYVTDELRDACIGGPGYQSLLRSAESARALLARLGEEKGR
jgi:hypothetical protein